MLMKTCYEKYLSVDNLYYTFVTSDTMAMVHQDLQNDIHLQQTDNLTRATVKAEIPSVV